MDRVTLLETEVSERRRPPVQQVRRTSVDALEFPGCDAVRMTEAELLAPEREGRRVEYWHAASETAWMVREPVSRYHEGPVHLLAALVRQVCQARGSGAECFGATDFRLREADGTLSDIFQPDQTVYLHPKEARLPGSGPIIPGEHDFPDVVFEVDNTTDVRRGRLVQYRESEFPEIWVEVPDLSSPSRPRGLRPGLVIQRREGARYVESAASRAFPGWRAAELHRALNEPEMTEETEAALWRVGRALGEREGTGPKDDHLLRRVDREGHARGHAEGVVEVRAGFVRKILASRGIEVPAGFPSGCQRAALAAASDEAVFSAAAAAESEADFHARLR